jgi:hypothetical protein
MRAGAAGAGDGGQVKLSRPKGTQDRDRATRAAERAAARAEARAAAATIYADAHLRQLNDAIRELAAAEARAEMAEMERDEWRKRAERMMAALAREDDICAAYTVAERRCGALEAALREALAIEGHGEGCALLRDCLKQCDCWRADARAALAATERQAPCEGGA